MKKMLNEGNPIHNFILCVYENFCDTILLRFRNRNKLRFRLRLLDKLRFRFHTAKSYGRFQFYSTVFFLTSVTSATLSPSSRSLSSSPPFPTSLLPSVPPLALSATPVKYKFQRLNIGFYSHPLLCSDHPIHSISPSFTQFLRHLFPSAIQFEDWTKSGPMMMIHIIKNNDDFMISCLRLPLATVLLNLHLTGFCHICMRTVCKYVN